MKTSAPCLERGGGGARRSAASAFTLTELMISVAILVLILAGVIASQLFGLGMFQITKAKLGANDMARKAINLLISEIRSAKSIQIGTGDLNSFSEIPPNTLQQGPAIQIYPSTNTSYYVRYYWSSADNSLRRLTNGSATSTLVANSISNSLPFTAEDYAGNILTNNQNNRVIGLNLQFYQLEYPIVQVGPGGLFDYYQLRTRITRRTLE
ncbi:MAG: type II secretion system GspH family protein [Verrucomicrobia bacterium]|nr:type II secretion system GspH family protein [Verrucomicrobiota bacterium]